MAPSESAGGEASGAALDAHREGYDGDTERSGRSGGRRKGVEQGPGQESVDGEGGAADAVNGRNRDWPGTSSDAFEIAVAVLKVRVVGLSWPTAIFIRIWGATVRTQLSSGSRRRPRSFLSALPSAISQYPFVGYVCVCEGGPVLFSCYLFKPSNNLPLTSLRYIAFVCVVAAKVQL